MVDQVGMVLGAPKIKCSDSAVTFFLLLLFANHW